MKYITINSSQNVNINFKSATVFSRIVAFLIDYFIISLYLYLIFNFIDSIERNLRNYLHKDYMFIVFFVFALPAILYTLISETISNGFTIGKFIMNIRVIKIDGFQASFIDFFIRWMFRLVDIFTFSGIPACLFILINSKSQRLGEIASGTATISLKQDYNLKHTILTDLTDSYIPTFTQVLILSDNDMRIIKENFELAVKNKNTKTIHDLSLKIESVLQIKNPFSTKSEFINTIIKDYNFYTQFN